MKRLVTLIVLVLLITGVVLAFRWLPWWALVIGFLLLILIGKFLAKRLLKKLFLMPFKAKGAVLRGAIATVHSVAPTSAPPTETASVTPAEPRTYYLLEATIAPQERNGAFHLWEPGDLRLARFNAVMRPESDEPDDETDCKVAKFQIDGEGEWKDDEGMKYGGPQRLRMWLAVQPGVRQLKFRYYFEEFGSVRLP